MTSYYRDSLESDGTITWKCEADKTSLLLVSFVGRFCHSYRKKIKIGEAVKIHLRKKSQTEKEKAISSVICDTPMR